MESSYGQAYRRLYEQHWWWRSREAAILGELQKLAPAEGFGNILDVGCGDGLFFDKLSAFGEVEGVEFSPELLDANGPHRSRIHVAPFDWHFQPAKTFGLITFFDVLEHLDDPVGALQHASSLLRAGGKIVITVPAFELLWTTHDDLNHHQARYTKSSFKKMAAEAGIRVEHMRYWYHWMFPAKLLARAAEAVTRAKPSNPEVPPALLNRLLYLTSRAEQKLLSPLPMPFGSSLFVVGSNQAGSNQVGSKQVGSKQ